MISDTTKHTFDIIQDIPWSTILKWTSGLINLLILLKYIRSKIVLNQLLVGRWEGNIAYCENTEMRLFCTLIVTDNAARTNKASFYYKQIEGEHISVRGMDELDDYDDGNKFISLKKWKPVFYREFHLSYNKEKKKTEINLKETIRYDWDCDITNVFFKPKLKVKIIGNETQLAGVLHKA